MDSLKSSSNNVSHVLGKESNDKMSSSDKNEVGFTTSVHSSGNLQRQLGARHLSMIALGGALGTGLLIGTGSGLARAGPAAILITYSLVGFVVFLVLSALGEIATWLPMSSGFTGYATRYVDPAMGFTLGYWCAYPFYCYSPIYSMVSELSLT
jgi:amino acid transporter